MNPEILFGLLTAVEEEDPIDFTGLPFNATDLRRLACLNVAEMLDSLPDADKNEREFVMAATITRLVLENMVLNARLAILTQEEP